MHTILIADDHAITREPLARLLRYEGYNTLTAANGLEALDLLRRNRPDLILLDMMMPKMNGVAFLRAASGASGALPGEGAPEDASDASDGPNWPAGTRGVPVILLTGIPDSPDVARAKELGIAEVLTKAKFTVEDLLGRVRVHLRPDSPSAPSSPPDLPNTAA